MVDGKTPVFSHLPFAISRQAVLFQRPAKGAGVDVPNLRLTPDELLALHQALQTYIDSDHENGADERLQVCRRVARPGAQSSGLGVQHLAAEAVGKSSARVSQLAFPRLRVISPVNADSFDEWSNCATETGLTHPRAPCL